MFERRFTLALPNGSGPAAKSVNLRLPDEDMLLELEAWIGNFGGSNVYIFDGDLRLDECQARILGQNLALVDCLLAVTGSGVCKTCLPDDVGRLTVFFEAVNNSGQNQTLQLRVYSGGHR